MMHLAHTPCGHLEHVTHFCIHSFVPVSNSKVRIRFYSAFKEERVTLAKNNLPLESIVGFCYMLVRWKLLVSLCTRSHPGR